MTNSSRDTQHETPAPSPTDLLPPKTTPTWEIELLISGVTVFALLQLPGLLDAWSDRMVAMQSEGVTLLALLAAIYVKAAAITLALTFVVHLALRAYWIALVGMRSVYPDGIRWDALKRFAPHSMRLAREALGSMDTLVEQADNRASLVFANGVGLALGMLIPVVFVTITSGLSLAVAILAGWRDKWNIVFGVIALAAFLPFLAATFVDRYLGARIHADSRAGRLLAAVLQAYEWLGMGRISNPLLLLSTSHVGYGRAQAVTAVLVFAIMGTVMVHSLLRLGQWAVFEHDYLPGTNAAASRALVPAHYAPSRSESAASAMLPYIQSEIVRGDYVRLFLPYRARRHGDALRAQCPDVPEDAIEDAAQEAQRLDALASCLARIHVAELDGTPLALDFMFGTDPRTGSQGMVAFIPVRDLAHGRHELRVARAPRTLSAKKTEGPFVIPFWR